MDLTRSGGKLNISRNPSALLPTIVKPKASSKTATVTPSSPALPLIKPKGVIRLPAPASAAPVEQVTVPTSGSSSVPSIPTKRHAFDDGQTSDQMGPVITSDPIWQSSVALPQSKRPKPGPSLFIPKKVRDKP